MTIATRNGVAWANIATLNGVAKANVTSMNGTTTSGGGSATAPSIAGSVVRGFNNGIGTPLTVNLPNVVSGETVCVVCSVYEGSVLRDPNVTATGYTWTDRPIANLAIGADVGFRIKTAVAGSSGSVDINLTNGDYKSLFAFRIQNNDAAIVDVAPATYDFYEGTPNPSTITLDTTTYSHCLVVAAFGWYDSARVMTADAAWPLLVANGSGWNDGSNDRNQIALVGKQVTSTGVYAPFMSNSGSGTDIGGIAIAFRGKAV